jgi:hypothetical protein
MEASFHWYYEVLLSISRVNETSIVNGDEPVRNDRGKNNKNRPQATQ